eukprot:scaffold274807_cov28-Tisochrysis_lutea.AAC.1
MRRIPDLRHQILDTSHKGVVRLLLANPPAVANLVHKMEEGERLVGEAYSRGRSQGKGNRVDELQASWPA